MVDHNINVGSWSIHMINLHFENILVLQWSLNIPSSNGRTDSNHSFSKRKPSTCMCDSSSQCAFKSNLVHISQQLWMNLSSTMTNEHGHWPMINELLLKHYSLHVSPSPGPSSGQSRHSSVLKYFEYNKAVDKSICQIANNVPNYAVTQLLTSILPIRIWRSTIQCSLLKYYSWRRNKSRSN